jgi:protein ImuA
MSLAATNLARPRFTAVVGELRRLLPRLESGHATVRTLPFDLPLLDRHLPQGGLVLGALHEIVPATRPDLPAAFGFAAALLGRMPPRGPILLVTSPCGFAIHGRPYGHGLHRLGLDPARMILVRAQSKAQALWAMEEALRSGAPAAVAGLVEQIDLKASQRLQVAARGAGVPLLLLRSAIPGDSSVAVTRWRVAAATAVRDRFGLLARWRWRLALERCRNGRPGEWVVEFDHAYRFRLAAALAHPALPRRADAPAFARAG